MKITQMKFVLDNGTEITVEPCWESWQQWGGTEEELCVTAPILDRLQESQVLYEIFVPDGTVHRRQEEGR